MIKQIKDNSLEKIVITDPLILELINSKELQRLSRITHLGLTYFFFPSATHNRFSHSLGTYEISRRILNKLSIKNNIDELTLISIKVAALLHDIGHGPFSHSFEKISNINHENYTLQLINDKETEINKIINKYDKRIIKEVCDLIKGKHKFQWANQIISSEIDADRMDYLLRDSINTGVKYGRLDISWIINNTLIVDGKLVFKHKALQSIESFILGRYHMNQSIYKNLKNTAYSSIYLLFFNRMKELYKQKKLIYRYEMFEFLFKGEEIPNDKFIEFDDITFIGYVKKSTKEKDKILNQLSDHFLNQKKLFFSIEKNKIEEINKEYDKKLYGQTWIIFNYEDHFLNFKNKGSNEALIFNAKGQIKKISEVSTIINKVEDKNFKDKKIAIFLKNETKN